LQTSQDGCGGLNERAVSTIISEAVAIWDGPGRPSAHSPAAGQELSGTIAQRLKLEHEIHDTASKLCILGFEPLK